MSLPLSNTGYKLSLADGSSWCLTGTRGAEPFVKVLAETMGLIQGHSPCEFAVIFLPSSEKKQFISPTSVSSWIRLYKQSWFDISIWQADTVPNNYYVEIEDESLDPRQITPSIRLVMDLFYRHSILSGGFPVHGALLEKGGTGIIIAASGGVGKTTCCEKIPSTWSVHSDDHTLISFNKTGGYFASPFPTWNDLIRRNQVGQWRCNYSVTLEAVFFLHRHSVDSVTQMGAGEGSIRLTEAAVQSIDAFFLDRPDSPGLKQLRKDIFQNSGDLAGIIPLFKLEASLNGKFWEKIEQTLGL